MSPTQFDEAYEVSEPPKDSADKPKDDLNLLTMPKEQAGRKILEDWDETTKDIKPWWAQWQGNRARAIGYTAVKIIKAQNESRIIIPKDASPSGPMLNKAARLRRRLRSTIFTDPAKPDVSPSSDSDEDRDAAELATRVLESQCSEGELDWNCLAGDTFDRGSDYGSGFVWFTVNPQGGGWRAKTIMACQQCMTVEDVDKPEYTGFPKVKRYVMADGTITDEAMQAAREWVPQLEADILDGRHVRFLQPTVRDISEATGVIIGQMVELGELKRSFADAFKKLKDEQIEALVGARAKEEKMLLPPNLRNRRREGDRRYVFTATVHHISGGQYETGCHAIACGDGTLLYRGPWYDEAHAMPLDLPLSQCKQYLDEDNPYGMGCMELLGPGQELLAALLEYTLQHYQRFLRRKTFLPMHSNLQPQQLQQDMASVLSIVPGGAPSYEEVPDLPALVHQLVDKVEYGMDDESGLQQQAQAVNAPSVTSAKQAQAIVDQVIVGLSDLIQNVSRFHVRGWRVMLQLDRAFMGAEQQVGYVGEDGAYKQKAWTGSDLGSAKDVRITKGSFTQLTPSAKANAATQYGQVGILPGDDFKDALRSNLGGLLGLQDNAHLLRVRRQITVWEQGPPKDWQPPQPQVNPQTGQPEAAPDPVSAQLWLRIPVDVQPDVAHARMVELGKSLSGARFMRWPKEWQAGIVQEYEAMRMAAGVQTLEEKSKAQGPPPPKISVNLKGELGPAGQQASEGTIPGYAQAAQSVQQQAGQMGVNPAELSPTGQAVEHKLAEQRKQQLDAVVALEKAKHPTTDAPPSRQ